MKRRQVWKWRLIAALLILGASLTIHETVVAQPPPPDAAQAMRVLTRGPVHEAFAETVTFDPEPGVVVPKSPPAAIEELPPNQKLDGAHVAWIPGYWAWDDERSNFLWVSGIWRDLPPGRQWVPGYWGNAPQGFQWTSGYWADARVSEVQYLPEPPATAETGPNVAAPSPDTTWLPGCWVWQNGRYVWRPGFWAGVQPDWDWVPAHYVWARRGYIFVDGYWDYSLARRGVLFAPVSFDADVYARPGYSYSPTTVIDLGALTNHLFLRPRYQHYYFGDYYAANYQTAGFIPSFSYNSGRYGYDPIFAHERWQHRQDNQWDQRVAADFQNRRDHEEARPPRIWSGQAGGGLGSGIRSLVGASLDQAAQNRSGAGRFQAIDQVQRQRLAQQSQDVNRFREQRQQWEARAASGPAAEAPGRGEARVRFPPSPLVNQANDSRRREFVPPQAHMQPPLDSAIQPRPRVASSADLPQAHTTLRMPLETSQPNRQSTIGRSAPQPQPRLAQPTSQPQPHAEAPRRAPQPAAGPPSAGPNQNKRTEKEKGK